MASESSSVEKQAQVPPSSSSQVAVMSQSQSSSAAHVRSIGGPLTCEGPHAAWLQKMRGSPFPLYLTFSTTAIDSVPKDAGKLRRGLPGIFGKDSSWRKEPSAEKQKKGWCMTPPIRVCVNFVICGL